MAQAVSSDDHAAMIEVERQWSLSPLLAAYRIHDFLREIVRRELPQLVDALDRFYASSSRFADTVMPALRLKLAHGGTASSEEMALVLKASAAGAPSASWEAFFLVAAKPNMQSDKVILNAFESAWNANRERSDRWKLLERIADRRLLLAENVARAALSSSNPREWEVFLGRILQAGERLAFKQAWKELMGSTFPWSGTAVEWATVRHLIDVLLRDRAYVPGTITM
jgi:hypothetical protein